MAAQEKTSWKTVGKRQTKLAEDIGVSRGGNGANLDIWSADSGGGGIAASGLHLHHPGGLPRTLDLPHLCCPPQTSQR